MIWSKLLPKLLTFTLVLSAGLALYWLCLRWADHPWTRDGQVRADVVKVAPRVSGYLVKVSVTDNQYVEAGQVLFQIDPAPYQLAVDKAEVSLDQARESVAALEAAVTAAEATIAEQNATLVANEKKVGEVESEVESYQALVQQARAGITSANAVIKQTKAQLEEAEREAERAQRLADQNAGSVEVAQARAATVKSYQAKLESSNAGLVKAQASLTKSQADLRQAEARLAIAQAQLAESQAAVKSTVATRDQAQANLGEAGEANVRVRAAKVALAEAKLDLQWTTISAPGDGYITNMNLLAGTFVSAGTPFATYVDKNSFRIDAYFQETKLEHIKAGDSATIKLMGHRDLTLTGKVASIGYAINPPNLVQTDGPANLVPTIQPTFDWIRLAQRVPVRIKLDPIPEDLQLISGTTASVSIGTAD